MDLEFSEKSSVGTFQKTQKRCRRSHEEEFSQCPVTSGPSKNLRNGDGTKAEKESAPPSKRSKFCGGKQTGNFCDVNNQSQLRNALSASRDALNAGRIALSAGRDTLSAGRDTLSAGRDALNAGRIALSAGRDALNAGRIALSAGRDALNAGRDALNAGRSALSAGRNTLSAGRNTLSAGRNTLSAGRNALSASRSALSTASPRGRNGYVSEQASASSSSDREVPQGRPSFSRQGVNNEVTGSRTLRSALHTRSSHSFSLLSLDMEPAEVELSSALFVIIPDLTEGMSFSSFQDISQNTGISLRVSLNSDVGLNSRGLSTTEINRLPTRCYSETCTSLHEAFHATECQICLSTYKERVMLRTLPCLHEFHSSCIDKWLGINRSCPVCRALIAGDQ